MSWRLGLVWAVIVVVLLLQAKQLPQRRPVDPKVCWTNLKLLLHKKKPPMLGEYREVALDNALAQWKLTGPINVALPPMYADEAFGNAGFLTSFLIHADAVLYNGPYPHPKLEIDEQIASDPLDARAYRFSNRGSNAALFIGLGDQTFPFGMTAWYDLVLSGYGTEITNPIVIDSSGRRVAATSVRALHPLNQVSLEGDTTFIELRHLSPILWTFPGDGHVTDPERGFFSDQIPDGIEVSWMPKLPERQERPFGMFLLAPLVAPTDPRAPAWWTLDEKLRRSIVDGKPAAERRPLLEALARDFPHHPLLSHYRVVSELGSDRFDKVWLNAQAKQCDLRTWYLVAWTKLPWSRVRRLPCLTSLGDGRLKPAGEYIAEWPVIAYRQLRDDPELRTLAERAVAVSYLRWEYRGFNFAPSNFAWLWLQR